MFRCQTCGRPINRPMKTPGDRMPFCNGAKRCNKKRLPRCIVCNSIYKPEDAMNKNLMMCVKGKQMHRFTTESRTVDDVGDNDHRRVLTAKELAVFDEEVHA